MQRAGPEGAEGGTKGRGGGEAGGGDERTAEKNKIKGWERPSREKKRGGPKPRPGGRPAPRWPRHAGRRARATPARARRGRGGPGGGRRAALRRPSPPQGQAGARARAPRPARPGHAPPALNGGRGEQNVAGGPSEARAGATRGSQPNPTGETIMFLIFNPRYSAYILISSPRGPREKPQAFTLYGD